MTTCGIYIQWDNQDVSKFYQLTRMLVSFIIYSKKMGGGGGGGEMPLLPTPWLRHWISSSFL